MLTNFKRQPEPPLWRPGQLVRLGCEDGFDMAECWSFNSSGKTRYDPVKSNTIAMYVGPDVGNGYRNMHRVIVDNCVVMTPLSAIMPFYDINPETGNEY